jgi:LmbE family N-acetylglucosaminyl deacetylase
MTTAGVVKAAMQRLPPVELVTLLDGRTPVVLAPHPDDDVIGCGGLIAEAVEIGLLPVIIYVTDGSGSHPGSKQTPPDKLARLREAEARQAAAILGVPGYRLHFLRLRDTAAPQSGPAFEDAVRRIADIVTSQPSAALFAPWQRDPHGDHLAVHLMAVAVARAVPVRLFSYPVWGWMLPDDSELGEETVAGWRLPIPHYRALKLRALAAHRSQTSDLIDDDPGGFRLDAATQEAMLGDDEVFLVTS